jgi:hypothetical protein
VEKAEKGMICISEEENICSNCGSPLYYRDMRKRSYRNKNGEKVSIYIRRLKCRSCECLHNELPDILIPYKQYTSDTIEEAIDDKISDQT